MHKLPNPNASIPKEEFSVEIGEVNGKRLYETKKHLKKITQK